MVIATRRPRIRSASKPPMNGVRYTRAMKVPKMSDASFRSKASPPRSVSVMYRKKIPMIR